MKIAPALVPALALVAATPLSAAETCATSQPAPLGWPTCPATEAAPGAPRPPDSRTRPPDPVRPGVHAVRTSTPPAIDGRIDDRSWEAAPIFDAFIENEPTEGGPGSERTELRVLFDDDKVYLAFHCFDSQPATINRSLARRDSEPASDHIAVSVDPSNSRRNARRFFLNAAGVQADTLFYDDTQASQSWDAVWEGAATVTSDGWTAELAIPLHVLGDPGEAGAPWGFLARRTIVRTHEVVSTVLVPRAANGYVSYFGALDGVERLGPQHAVEIVPYVAMRSLFRPRSSDPTLPSPRVGFGSADVGADLALYPGRGLVLNATLNPDFGEVQPDQIVLNVSSFETYYPEQRPFFTQGMDLFQTAGGLDSTQALFYSRRIGLTVPILGAAKLTGAPLPGLSIGLLDAIVDGPWQRGAADGSIDFHAERPFHLGPAEELPPDEVVPENFAAATARVALGGSSWIGGRIAAATPLGGECSAADLARTPVPARCTTHGVNAGAIDASLKTPDGDYGLFGQAVVSQSVLGQTRSERDGTAIAPGDVGAGGFVRAGKLGGEGLRLQGTYTYASPKFDLNSVGFSLDSNLHDGAVDLGVSYPNGFGPLHSLDAWLHGELGFSADGRDLRRYAFYGFEINLLLPGFHKLSWLGGVYPTTQNIRELRGSGVSMDTSAMEFTKLTLDTDTNEPLALHALAALGHHEALGPTGARIGWTFEGGLTWRPIAPLQTQVTATADHTPWDPRFIQQQGDGFLLGRLDATTLTVTLKQDWAMTRRLTLQAYLQLFTGYGIYGPYFTGQGTPDQPLRQANLVPTTMPTLDPSFHTAELVANVVGRWEYRPGSTLFLVYSRTQSERPPLMPDGTLGAGRLFDGPATDLVLVKWAQFLTL